MNELLEKNQIISIVPQNFRKSNKGKILDVKDSFFALELFYAPEEIIPKKVMEFYSQTKNGMLYFNSGIVKVEGNKVVVSMPKKHRFLQRRMFSRVEFIKELDLILNNKVYKSTSIDLSVGGVKLKIRESLKIDEDYDLCINLTDNNIIKCKFQPIKIEKKDNNFYTLAGRFKNLTIFDKIKLVQFCMKKNMEDINR